MTSGERHQVAGPFDLPEELDKDDHEPSSMATAWI